MPLEDGISLSGDPKRRCLRMDENGVLTGVVADLSTGHRSPRQKPANRWDESAAQEPSENACHPIFSWMMWPMLATASSDTRRSGRALLVGSQMKPSETAGGCQSWLSDPRSSRKTFGDPSGSRTRVPDVRGRCPNH